MDLPEYMSDDDFRDDVQQLRELVGPDNRYPLPTILQVGPGRNGFEVTVDWGGRLYRLYRAPADDGGDTVAISIVDAPNDRAVLEDTEVIGDVADLPFPEHLGVYVIAWRVWERVDAAQELLLFAHAQAVGERVNEGLKRGFASVAKPS